MSCATVPASARRWNATSTWSAVRVLTRLPPISSTRISACPAVDFEGGLLEVAVRQGLLSSTGRGLLDGEVAVADERAGVDLGLHLAEALFGFGFGCCDGASLLAVDRDLGDPSTGGFTAAGAFLVDAAFVVATFLAGAQQVDELVEWATGWATSAYNDGQRRTSRSWIALTGRHGRRTDSGCQLGLAASWHGRGQEFDSP